MKDRPDLVVIGGPTGVGKTAVAVALAARVPLEVISADSRQVYRGMDAATGKPTAAERAAVAHHLIDVVDPDDRYQAARFRTDAEALVGAIRARGRLPVVVGGTGLYIRALLRGLDPAPPADLGFRRELATVAAREGGAALHARLAGEAPALARRLRARAAAFVAAGLPAEVAGLLARGYAPALPALGSMGYREFVQVAQGRLGPEEALRRMQRDTVRYAKRQWTWFRREPGVTWIDVEAAGGPAGVARRIEADLRERGVLV